MGANLLENHNLHFLDRLSFQYPRDVFSVKQEAEREGLIKNIIKQLFHQSI